MGKDLESLVAPTIMAIIFVAIVVVILRAQNPRLRAEAKARADRRAATVTEAARRPAHDAPSHPTTTPDRQATTTDAP